MNQLSEREFKLHKRKAICSESMNFCYMNFLFSDEFK